MTNRIKFYLFASLALVLSGCVSRQDTAIVQTQNGQVRVTGPTTLSKTVLSGQTIDVLGCMSVNPDCTPAQANTIRIIQQPSHGHANIVTGESYPTYPAGNPRAACNSTKVPLVSAKYTPAPGFTGTDFMSIEYFTPNGGDSGEIKVLVTVK